MRIVKLKINDADLDRIVNYLIEHLSFDYENHSTEMSILASEEFYFRTFSAQLNMIIVKKEMSDILIDIIGAAGGSGLLNIDWWSEKGYTNRAKKVINKYKDEFNLIIENVE
jgi:hypothetical protein